MTNVSGPGKMAIRKFLRTTAVQELQKLGYKVERIPRAGKGSLRRITKDGISKVATIRTSQDAWIAFPRNTDDTGWSTLEEADVVVVASLAEKGGNRANFHLMDADDIRARFNRAREAKLKADHVMPTGRGVWISLYNKEAAVPVSMVGAGAGLLYKPFAANVPVVINEGSPPDLQEDDVEYESEQEANSEDPLTIAEAKRRLALTFGVDPTAIRITVEG